jgi:signal transduction histidine kinase
MLSMLRNYEIVIGGLIVLIIGSVILYGHYITKLLKRKYRELEEALRRSQDAEAEARAYSSQIQSVNEDVVRLNRELESNLNKLRDAQDELVRKGRLSQLGQLTATVAHELRNPLGTVRTSAFLMERKLKDKGLGVEPQLQRINSGVTRCDSIISQLLDFARTKQLQCDSLVLDEWVAKLAEDEVQSLPEVIAVECHLGAGDTKADFDPARMSRVLINLLSNAAEAMVGKGDDPAKFTTASPKVIIRTTVTPRGVELSVSDNGPGIPAEVLPRILEPLFTTKNFGTGLGLPAVEKILEQHGGGLDIASVPGQGATFTVWWPLKTQQEEAA